jgi:hypothetical protein
MPWVIAAVVAPIAMVIVTKTLRSDTTADKSPADLLAQARAELADQKPERALDTVTLAELRSPAPETRQALADLRRQIEAQIKRSADLPQVQRAQEEVEAMRNLEATALATKPPRRAAARALVRAARAWQSQHNELATRYPELAPVALQVRALEQAYVQAADLDQPDSADDVFFAVERRLAMPKPWYKDALQQIDAYMSGFPKDPQIKALMAKREDVLAAASAEFEARTKEARAALAEKQVDVAKEALIRMRECMMESFQPPITDAVAKEIESAEQGR